MPEAQEKFQQAVKDVLSGVMFENWLRFYFISEVEGEKDAEGNPKLAIVIPEKGMEKIKELYPRMLSMAEDVNGKEASFATSQSAVCTWVACEVDGKSVQQGTSQALVDSRAFQTASTLFNIWVQAYEQQLDQQFLDFGQWVKLFETWRASDQGKDMEMKIEMQAPTGSSQVQ
ncbi:MAG: hypothetical protein K6C33_05920 [Desulfovibrio sp.]|nr:hypothetical protein [Desulfovibrio sp.]MBQ2476534.1 hypothetical protein [Desulfovibrio sp.]MBQ4124712.1 hypothetical protein [Desulfovibrio sp.]MCR5169983.1 hypothetical protein [Desulfovibrio sp.]